MIFKGPYFFKGFTFTENEKKEGSVCSVFIIGSFFEKKVVVKDRFRSHCKLRGVEREREEKKQI